MIFWKLAEIPKMPPSRKSYLQIYIIFIRIDCQVFYAQNETLLR